MNGTLRLASVRDARGSQVRRPRGWVTIALVLTLAAPTLAAAPRPEEPRLLRSQPAADATLEAGPTEIRLWFSERPERAVSRIRIDRGTTSIVTGNVESGDDDDLRVALVDGALGPGRYTVTWRTAGADLAPARGRYLFEVRAR